jgi:hypothetical protein
MSSSRCPRQSAGMPGRFRRSRSRNTFSIPSRSCFRSWPKRRSSVFRSPISASFSAISPQEGLSIRDIRNILESMLAVNGTTDVDWNRYIVFAPYAEQLCPDTRHRDVRGLLPADFSEFVRSSFKRYISHKHTKGGTLIVYLLDPAIERSIAKIATDPLTDEEKVKLNAAVRRQVGPVGITSKNSVVLTSTEGQEAFATADRAGVSVLARAKAIKRFHRRRTFGRSPVFHGVSYSLAPQGPRRGAEPKSRRHHRSGPTHLADVRDLDQVWC